MFEIGLFALATLSGATAAVAGFGIGSLLTPLLLISLGPDLAVAAIALPHLAATALRLVRHRHYVDAVTFRRFGILSGVGGLVGGLLFMRLGARGLTLVLGALLVATALYNLSPRLRRWHPSAPIAPLLGLLSGLFGGLAGNQGGLRAAALLSFDLPPRVFLATSTAVALVVDLARTPIYLVRAAGDLAAYTVPIAIATAGCLLGTILGERVLLGMPVERYRRVVGAAVGVLGVWLLVRAATT